MTTFRRRVHSRPLRTFLIGMLAVPLVSLLALWAFAASITVSAAIKDRAYTASSKTTNAGVYGLVSELPQERAQTYVWLLSGQRAPRAPVLAARKLVDTAVPPAKSALLAIEGTANPVLSALTTDLGRLPSIRKAVDSGTMSAPTAFAAYSDIVDEVFGYFLSTVNERSGASLGGVSVGAVDGAYALEMASREAALIDGTLSDGGRLTPAIRELFAGAAAQRHELLRETQALVPADLYPSYVNDSPAYRQFQAMETQILDSSGTRVPVNGKTWASVTTAYLEATYKSQNQTDAPRLQAMSASESDRLLTEAISAGGVGLAAVVVSVFLLVWFGRKVTRDLGRLNSSVRDMAEERLPRVVGRLRRGEDVDVPAESPPPYQSSISEVSAISESFATVQGAAVAAAVDQARLRKGVNQVFLNISMRNQSLLYRQLKMLDSMERKTSDPGALAELFRLDHLTTRMRRHAEGLIILSGSTPDRGRREPVPVVDVLRAAVAEVEDYVRVDVVSESRDLVAGNAVSDMIHLLAELVENAAVFSPPNTRIEVRADRVGTGLVAEIEDRGLGLSEAERDAINQRLASPPEFDLANSNQLGLFIVSQLSTRHGIRVSLRESAYGGTTAIVRLPFGVVVRDDDAAPVAEEGWVIPDGNFPPPELFADEAAGSEYSPQQPGQGPSPSFVGTGRHRLRTAPTGRLEERGGNSRHTEMEGAPAPRTLPRAPWELASPALASRSPASGTVARAVSPQAAAGPASSGSHLGMPIRVPQASMAPQLRTGRQADSGQEALEEPGVDDRAPETTRDMMALMQQGWKRGRLDDLDDPEDAPRYGTDW
ncbi:MAG TPA: nitrate- and nitrite sensing domain-containing protein [Trebonia sp.]|nr:nitrate- and nitrite sensing domain-containing protein [Trebonia sp.]